MKIIFAAFCLLFTFSDASSRGSSFEIARLQYEGGGDWYNDPSSEVNLLKFVKEQTNINVNPQYIPVNINSPELFNYPFLFVTGHGSINLDKKHKDYLAAYLEAGGFIYIDDDFGMDKFIRPLLNGLIDGEKLEVIPLSHPIYSSHFSFATGVPKVHEHDDKKPEALGLFKDDRLVLLYTYESNPSDGWADKTIHDNSPEKREAALKFGTNVIVYALTY
jgi:hypothetical protein